MTQNEAVEIVEKYIDSYEGGAAIYEALTMAADALKNEADVIDMVLEIIDKNIKLAKDCRISTTTLWLVRQGIFALKGGEQE